MQDVYVKRQVWNNNKCTGGSNSSSKDDSSLARAKSMAVDTKRRSLG